MGPNTQYQAARGRSAAPARVIALLADHSVLLAVPPVVTVLAGASWLVVMISRGRHRNG